MHRSTYIVGLETMIYEYVKIFVATNGYCPSVREMANHIGTSAATVRKRLVDMEKKGVIARHGHRAVKLLR